MTPIGYAIKPLVYYFCADLYVINIFLLYFPQKKYLVAKKEFYLLLNKGIMTDQPTNLPTDQSTDGSAKFV